MNIRYFASASALVLLSWLGATYLHSSRAESYPKLMKNSLPVVKGVAVDTIQHTPTNAALIEISQQSQ